MWGATRRRVMDNHIKRFQSTHPCGVRRKNLFEISLVCRISIHAPMWGATRILEYDGLADFISIHAPMWGATIKMENKVIVWKYFNPRTHVGCDSQMALPNTRFSLFQSTHPCGVRQHTQQAIEKIKKISIHAPMWGATKDGQMEWDSSTYFNPRTHVGCDDKQ